LKNKLLENLPFSHGNKLLVLFPVLLKKKQKIFISIHDITGAERASLGVGG
jgi:hypothetical protein